MQQERGGVEQEMEREEEKGSIYLVRVGPVPSSSTKMKSGSLSFSPFSSHPLPIPLSRPLLFHPSLSCSVAASRLLAGERIVADSKTSPTRYMHVTDLHQSHRIRLLPTLPSTSTSLPCFIRFQAPLKRKFPPR